MKVRVIADDAGVIKGFAIRPENYDPKKHGDIFPTAGHRAHDLDIPQDHEHVFLREPHKIPGMLRISVAGGKAAFSLAPHKR